MKEVSCRATIPLVHAWQRAGLPVDELVRGLPHDVDYLLDKHERIDWDCYRALVSNMRVRWGQVDFEAVGREFTSSPLFRPFTIVARLFFSSRDLFRWFRQYALPRAEQMFRCVDTTLEQLGAGYVRATIRMKDGYELLPEFFYVTRGTLVAIPRVVALPPAEVALELTERGGVFDIRYEHGGGALAWMWRFFTWPFTALNAAREMQESQVMLEKRYYELDDYRNNLEKMVAERTAELEDALARLEKAQSARERIFANINHEIRTPLSLILLAVGAIQHRRGDLDAKSASNLDTVVTSVQRLLHLVDGLLLLAAGQEGKLRIKRTQRDVARMIRLLLAAWGPAFEEAGLAATYDGPERCVIAVDEAAIERVLTNLLSNAVKFTPAGGSVVVGLVHGDETIEISVRDTGIGLSAEFRERLFGRFEQGLPAIRSGARGSGIGLSIVKELVEAHGGTVAADPNENRGTVFRIAMPKGLVLSDEGESSVAAAISIDPRSLTSTSQSTAGVQMINPETSAAVTALIAEDDPELRQELVGLLRREYRVIAAPDGVAALRAAKQYTPDILITDVGMPGMDGFELVQRFRELPGNRLAPAILLTAYTNIVDRITGLESGAVDYIIKPFDPEELLARIKAQLRVRDMALRLNESERLASLGTLMTGLAHELRNPANAVVNAIGPLRSSLPAGALAQGSAAAELLGVIDECGEQIRVVVGQLIGFTRSGDLECRPEEAANLVERAITIVAPAITGIDIRREVACVPVICCAPFVIQILTNLIENGAHAAGHGGWVKVEARELSDMLVIEISDSGDGIPADLRAKVFQPFFTTKKPGKGTGLGLVTSRNIAERHGGKLEIVDTEAGMAMRVELPMTGPNPARPVVLEPTAD